MIDVYSLNHAIKKAKFLLNEFIKEFVNKPALFTVPSKMKTWRCLKIIG